MKRSEAIYLRSVVEQASQSLEDAVALTAVELFPYWKVLVEEEQEDGTKGREVDRGFRFRYEGILYRTEQPKYKFVKHYIPGSVGTESLFSVVDENHKGTKEDPIPYQTNMEIYKGLYYTQNGVLYLCTRDSGQPLHHDLALLIGAYVEVVSE